MLISAFFVRLFTFHSRATPDAQERIPTAPHVRTCRATPDAQERIPTAPHVRTCRATPDAQERIPTAPHVRTCRATPDAQERIPTAPHARTCRATPDLPRNAGRAGAHPYRATRADLPRNAGRAGAHPCGAARASLLPRQLRNKVVWVRRLQFAGGVELRDLIRRKRPSDRAKVIFELLHPSRPDDRCGYTWLLQEPVNRHLGRVPLQGSGNFVQTIQGMPRLLVIIGTPFFAPILLLGEFDT